MNLTVYETNTLLTLALALILGLPPQSADGQVGPGGVER
jgi:hypothetical protein